MFIFMPVYVGFTEKSAILINVPSRYYSYISMYINILQTF